MRRSIFSAMFVGSMLFVTQVFAHGGGGHGGGGHGGGHGGGGHAGFAGGAAVHTAAPRMNMQRVAPQAAPRMQRSATAAPQTARVGGYAPGYRGAYFPAYGLPYLGWGWPYGYGYGYGYGGYGYGYGNPGYATTTIVDGYDPNAVPPNAYDPAAVAPPNPTYQDAPGAAGTSPGPTVVVVVVPPAPGAVAPAPAEAPPAPQGPSTIRAYNFINACAPPAVARTREVNVYRTVWVNNDHYDYDTQEGTFVTTATWDAQARAWKYFNRKGEAQLISDDGGTAALVIR